MRDHLRARRARGLAGQGPVIPGLERSEQSYPTIFAEVTFGASLAAAVGLIEEEAAMTAASIAVELAAAAARLGAAALVAHSQAENYQKLVADIKR